MSIGRRPPAARPPAARRRSSTKASWGRRATCGRPTVRRAGGDPIMTAALAAAAQQDTNMSAVAADLAVAQNYKTYLQNAELINLLMAFNPDSTFTAGWELTLLRAQELGLEQVHEEAGWTATLEPGAAGAGYKFHETVRDQNGILVEEEYFNDDGSQADYRYYMHVAGATYAIAGSDDTVTAGARSSVTMTGDRDAITVGGSGAAVTVMRAIPRRRGSRIRLRSRCCRTVPGPTAGTSRSAPGRASLPRSRPTPTLCKMAAK